MFKTNIFIKNVENSRKIIAIIVVLAIIINIMFSIVNTKKVYAVSQERQIVSEKTNKYPGYIELINKLKQSHPNWKFIMFYTGLDWNQVIKNESTAWHGRNLIYSNKTGEWICQTCNDKRYDNGYWRCASEATVSYYMDPRNFLNDDYIFQFEESVFNQSIHTVDGIMKKTNGTFLAGKENAEAILQACKNVNISPYQVVSRLLLEQGDSGTILSRGNNGWFNVFNVGASGNSSSQIIANATEYAKNNGWNTLAKSIIGGIEFLKSKYIGIGQNTIYLQKFDVDSSDGTLYYHQYMQNVSAAYTEGQTVRNMYKSAGVFDNSISFVIPVYENMPKERSPIPGTQSLVTQNVKINQNNINVREQKNTNSKVLAELKNGDIVLRIELGNNIENGYKWDKVVLKDGKKGYIANNYLTKIDDVTNCKDSVIVNTSVNLRNGPGTNGTSIITTLTQGQALTRIETGKYNGLDEFNWDRVVLLDGRQGYIASKYIDLANNMSNVNNNSNNELVKVVTQDGLTVREEPGTDKRNLTYIGYNEIVTRTEKGVATANGYTWDKIVTGNGIVGYIARGDSKESYIESINGNNDTNSNAQTTEKQTNEKQTDTNNNKITYTLEECDVDQNKSVNSADLYCLIKFLKDNNGKYDKKYDINKDNKINSGDLYAIILFLKQN